MLLKLSIALATAALTACPAAWAAPTTVQLRVEGASATIFEGPVTTDGRAVDGGDGTGAQKCDGTNFGAYPTPGPTMTSALADAAIPGGWRGTWNPGFEDFLIDRIGADSGTSFDSFWGTVANFQPTDRGGCQERVQSGDEALFALGNVYSQPVLKLVGPPTAAVGTPITVTVTDGKTGSGADAAHVGGSLTGPDGGAGVTFDSAGLKQLKAERAGSIRSNAVLVCASATGSDDCGVPPEQLGTPATRSGQARDSRAPQARIAGPRDGGRYRRGPRLLRGTATDAESGVTTVKLALSRRVRGKPCQWWSGRRERFVGTHCRKVFFFAIGEDTQWSYLLPRRLPPGRYVLDVKAFDRARNRDEQFVRGRNRVAFEVLRARGPGRKAAAAARAARVRVMVVGRRGVIRGARELRAGSARVRVGGRRCKVAASTPLAALARALSGTGTGYGVRDFGRCSRRSPDDSGQLLVNRVGGERNSGSDGWFYKVNHRAGTAGGADPLGPLGRGRLRNGDEVLWFFCTHDERTGSCQPSLGLRPSRRRGESGEQVLVTVRAYDNEARTSGAAGAAVSLGPASAVTNGAGVAGIVLPVEGRYELAASGEGMLPAFPIPFRVGAGG